ncbi:carbon-nitrogen hydrolase family protein [Methanomassiliicoccaceae archaeon COG_1]|nr:carbon-nitrogen hydrolase family protein [Methanomassiliicoccaceae archaeon COG_1]
MGIRMGLCQLHSDADIDGNLKMMEGAIIQNKADLYVFPELFLTGYGNTTFDPEAIVTAESRLRILCNERDAAVVFGTSMQWYNGVTNSALFVTPQETYRYDKLYPAVFGPYDERMYEKGTSPRIVEWEGMRFGLEICYDVMFPEIHRFYAVHGCDMVVCLAASGEQSERIMRTVLPARSLENTVYTVFCNGIGDMGDGNRMFGGSAMYSPLGEEVLSAGGGGETVAVGIADSEVVAHARGIRHHLQDLRGDILWLP